MKRYLLIHYGEIGLKKANTDYFVNKLIQAIRSKLQAEFKCNFRINHTLSRILVLLEENFDMEKIKIVIDTIFGIKNFKFVYEGSVKLEELGEQMWNNMPDFVSDLQTRPATYKVEVKRSMPMTLKSFEIGRDLGSVLYKKGLDLKVKLNNPDFVIDVEFFNNHAYFSYEKFAGTGGLSPASQGKLVALISAGIDSPVASYMMMRRGARVIFVHFHGYPFTDKDEMSQVKNLVKILSRYQSPSRLYLIPFGKIQRDVAVNLDVPAKLRTVLYRRTMLRIAEIVSRKEGAKGLITGDNFGQVASQTPENIFAIHEASTIPIFQPLIGFDKEEIIKYAEKIGTFEISKLPCKDTCGMFMPEHPEIKAKVINVKNCEKLLPIDEWVVNALKEAEIIDVQ